MRPTIALLALTPIAALASPQVLSHQGRLTDASGVPIEGEHDVIVRVYDAVDDPVGDAVFSETIDAVRFSDGYYAVRFGGSATTLTNVVNSADALWVGVSVSGQEFVPRAPIDATAYAVRADTAYRAVALDSTGVCDASAAGALRYVTADRTLELCDGNEWEPLATVAELGTAGRPGSSCADLKAEGFTDDGVYWIDPTGQQPYQVWCDMVGQGNDGGGWTLLAKTDGSNNNHWSSTDRLENLTSPATTSTGATGDQKRTALGRYYRMTCGDRTLYGYLLDTSVSADVNWSGSVFSWAGVYSSSPSNYSNPNSPDCGDASCPGPAFSGRNWRRAAYSGCGINSSGSYGTAGTLWVK